MTKKEEKIIKDEKALENKCLSCNASIKFNPTAGKWKCDYCASSFTLEEMQKYTNASSKENNEKENLKEIDNTDYTSYKCQSCGAEIIADEQTAATFCVYCGNTAILKSKLSGKFSPDKIIPFKQEKEKAILAFKGLSKGRPLMPSDFNNTNNIEKIRGIYIPFWIYDMSVSGDVNFSAKQIDSWTRGDTHYTKTSIYKIYRSGSMNYHGIPVDASTRFNNDIMNTIEPFDYNEFQDYNHAFLSGFYAEKYDIDGIAAFSDAEKRALESSKNIMLNDAMGYVEKVVTENTLDANQLKRQYALLPVWMVNVKYNEKQYLFAMNGQTGEFVGNIPLDKRKTVIYTILIYIITFIVCIIGSYILYKIGGNA